MHGKRLRLLCLALYVLYPVGFYLMFRQMFVTYVYDKPSQSKLEEIGDLHVLELGDAREVPHVPPTSTAKPVQPMEYEFVISHYKEKLDWLKPVANYCHVYDKGHDKGLKPSLGINHWDELPNVGRESHTYLYHIINNYDNLANITVFVQGEIASHTPTFCFPTLQEFVAKATEGIPCVSSGKVNWGKIVHAGKWKKEYDQGHMRHAKNSTLGQFYKTMFGREPPQSEDLCYAGCFSATRRCLQKHPKKFYQKLISFVDDHVNPEEGYYLERLWRTIVAC